MSSIRGCSISASVALLAFVSESSAAIESQALEVARGLPAAVQQVFRCGTWAAAGQRGHHRVILVEVSSGAGTEVYVQRIVESVSARGQSTRVLSTTAVRELNDDHAQYQVVAARCLPEAVAELRATFEHDDGNAQRRIRLTLAADGGYRVSNVVLGAKHRR